MNNHTSDSEQWVVLDFNPRYAVSNQGRVMRVQSGKSTHPGKILTPRKHYKGYVTVVLLFGTIQSRKEYRIHQLVAHAFIGMKPDGYEINHINGIKDDNRVENLEYVTPSENVKHAFQYLNHFRGRGDLNGNSVLSESQAIQIKTMLNQGAKGVDVAKHFGVSVSTVSAIKCGRIWKHLEDKENVR